jgi:hypothetical protein
MDPVGRNVLRNPFYTGIWKTFQMLPPRPGLPPGDLSNGPPAMIRRTGKHVEYTGISFRVFMAWRPLRFSLCTSKTPSRKGKCPIGLGRPAGTQALPGAMRGSFTWPGAYRSAGRRVGLCDGSVHKPPNNRVPGRWVVRIRTPGGAGVATLHLMVGLPCSGKTTLARKLETERSASPTRDSSY